jgi:hypothetical protein
VRTSLVDLLRCPVTGAPFDLDAARESGDEVVEGFLVSQDDRRVRLLLAGVAVVPPDLRAHMRAQGSVYRRTPVRDPRLARFVLGESGPGHDAVPFDEVVGHYRDLVVDPPAGYDATAHPDDEALDRLLTRVLGSSRRPGTALVVGCGVGRGAFVANAFWTSTLGVDASLALVRRARNVAVSREHFFLPGPRELGVKEVRVDLDALVREGADFAAAHAEVLPLADASVDAAIVTAGDARGPWADPGRVLAEARRVLRPGGALVRHAALGAAGARDAAEREGPWAWEAA